MSNFKEVIKKERESLKSKTFSMDSFTELLTAYLNESEFESHIIKKKDGVAQKITTQPVKKFRKVLKNILVEAGVDKNDAEGFVTTYKFKKKDVQEMYDFFTDFMYQYLQTGRKLDLFKKEDVVASLELVDVKEEKNVESRIPNSDLKAYSNIKAHKKLKSKSSTPEWKKEKIDKPNGKVLKAMEIVCKSLED